MSAPITRGQLLSRSAKGGAALLVAGSALGTFVDTAAAAPLPVGRSRLRAAARRRGAARVRLLLAGDRRLEHEPRGHGVPEARLRQRAGALPVGRRDPQRRRRRRPPSSGDIDFSYPAGTFASQGSIVKFAAAARDARSSARTSARSAASRPTALKAGLAQIAACEAQHAAYFTTARGRQGVQPLVPAGAHHRPGLGRARRVHGIGKGHTYAVLSHRSRCLALVVALRVASPAARRVGQVEPRDRRDHGLRRLVDDHRPARRSTRATRTRSAARRRWRRRSRTARRPTSSCRRTRRVPAALYAAGRGREAGQLHAQHARGRRAEVESGRDQVDLRPDEARAEDRRGGRRRSRSGATRCRC